jgi:hypothetical protein
MSCELNCKECAPRIYCPFKHFNAFDTKPDSSTPVPFIHRTVKPKQKVEVSKTKGSGSATNAIGESMSSPAYDLGGTYPSHLTTISGSDSDLERG